MAEKTVLSNSYILNPQAALYRHSRTILPQDVAVHNLSDCQADIVLQETDGVLVTRVTDKASGGTLLVTKKLKINASVPEEIRMMQHVNSGTRHRNFLQLLDVSNPAEDGSQVFLMDYCTGGDLRDQQMYWESTFGLGVPMEPPMVLHITAQIGAALAFLHHGVHHQERHLWVKDARMGGIVHGDIKPENILLRWGPDTERPGFPDCVLTDFGNGWFIERPLFRYYGTPDYLPWEAKANLERGELWLDQHPDEVTWERMRPQMDPPITTKADVFVFGSLGIELMVRDPVVADEDTFDQRMAALMQRPGYPRGMLNTLKTCLARDPAQRPAFAVMEKEVQDPKRSLLPLLVSIQRALHRIDNQAPDQRENLWVNQPAVAQ